MHLPTVIFAVIIVIILVVVWLCRSNSVAYESYLNGYWMAEDDDFCRDSEISAMMLMIGEEQRGWFSSSRVCHLVIMPNMANQCLTLEYKRGWSSVGISKYTIKAKVTFDDYNLWSDEVLISCDIINGIMLVESADKSMLYAKLYKMNEISHVISKMPTDTVDNSDVDEIVTSK
jgi:hypothetical protein